MPIVLFWWFGEAVFGQKSIRRRLEGLLPDGEYHFPGKVSHARGDCKAGETGDKIPSGEQPGSNKFKSNAVVDVTEVVVEVDWLGGLGKLCGCPVHVNVAIFF